MVSRKLKIQWSHDSNECETCGYNSSTGAVVTLDDEVIFNEPANAGCTSCVYVDEGHILEALCKHLNIKIEETE